MTCFKTLFLLYAPLVIIGQISAAQEPADGFTYNDGNVVWSKSFETNKDFRGFLKEITTSGMLEDISVTDSTVSGKTIKITPDYKGAGYSAMKTPSYLLGTFVRGFAVVEYAAGTYKVTIKRMFTIEAQDINAGILSTRMGEETEMEFWAFNNKKNLRSHFKDHGSKIISYTLERKFRFQ